MNSYPRALLRFWWLIVLGLAAGALTGTLMLYRVDLELPPSELPKLTERAKVSYDATLALLVDSPVSPYLRTQTREVVEQQPRPVQTRTRAANRNDDRNDENETPTAPPPQSAPLQVETRLIPDRGSLVRAANFYPLLIESDAVTALREELIGPVPGVVRAKALYASRSGGRIRPSTVPVIQIDARAPRPEQAIKLVEGTAQAFKTWLVAQQKRTKVPPQQKILLKPLASPQKAVPVGGPTYGLPLIASGAVVFGFGALALVLDRTFPKRRRRELEAADEAEADAEPEQPRVDVSGDGSQALGDAVAQVAREVGALRAQATQKP